MKKNTLSLLALLFFANIIYFNSFYNSFHFDDFASIVENKNLKDINHLGELYSSFFSIFKNRVLVQTSFLINYQFSRLNVFGYHLFNNCVHSLVVVMVFFLSRYLFLNISYTARIGCCAKKKFNPGMHLPFFTALFFGMHPIFTESVVYISSRSSLLLTLFFLLSFYFLIRFLKFGRKAIYFVFFLLFCFLGMAAKKNFVVLPMVVLLYGFCFYPDWLKRKINEFKISCMFISLISLAFVFYVIFFISNKNEFIYGIVGPQEIHWSPYQYFLTELNVIVFYYLKKLFFPLELSIDPFFNLSNTFFSLSCLSLGILVFIFIFVSRSRKSNPLFCFGGLWILITMAPTSSFLPLLDFASEHRLYLPGFGFALILSSVAYKHRNITTFPILLFLLFFASLAIERNNAWKSPQTIWSDAIHKSPGKARPYYNLAKYYQESGKLEEAMKEYQKVMAIVPNSTFPLVGIGSLYMKMGDLDLAEENLKKALMIQPRESEATTQLALVYFKMGKFELAEKLLTKEYIKDDQIDAFYLLGQIYSMQNKNGLALQQFQRAIKLNPDFVEAYVGMGIICGKENKFELSEKYFLKSIHIKKENPDACFNLGYLYFMRNRYEEAVVWYKKALDYDSKMEKAWISSGDSFFMLKNYDEAIKSYGFISEESELFNEARYKTGFCYMEIGDVNKADSFFSQLSLKRKENAMLYLEIGKRFDDKGNKLFALKYYKIAAELDPENIKINFQ